MGQRQLFTLGVVNRPSDENKVQGDPSSIFNGDNFVRFMGNTFARGGIVPQVQTGRAVHKVRLAISGNFDPPPPCHTLSHIPGPLPRKYVPHLEPPSIFSRPSTKI